MKADNGEEPWNLHTLCRKKISVIRTNLVMQGDANDGKTTLRSVLHGDGGNVKQHYVLYKCVLQGGAGYVKTTLCPI